MTKEKKKEYAVISFLPAILLAYSVISTPSEELFRGMKNIFLSNGVLLTDYFIVGGKGAAIFNASAVTLLNILLVYKLDMKINGLVLSGLYLMFGFSFMGKNILNIIPFYIGAYLYARYSNKEYKTVVIVCMLTTSLSPIVSAIAEAYGFSPVGIIAGFLAGIIIGFIMPPVSGHVLQFHSGYTLYNTGLAAGLVAILFYAILELLGLDVASNKDFVETMDYTVLSIFIFTYLSYIIYGFWINNRSFKGLKELFTHSGRLVTDFTVTEGFPVVVMNMGILGFMCLIISFFMFPMINGPILAGMITVIAFAGFGKHLKNVLPVIAGVTLAFWLLGKNVSVTVFAITLFFSTCLAPISGKFGAIAGIIVGFVNFCLVLNMGALHGGLNLYNTGLSAGIVASISVPILQIFSGGTK